jgi:hypothetical protein
MKNDTFFNAFVVFTIAVLILFGVVSELNQPHGTPQSRLDKDPSLTSACQHEIWMNTTHSMSIVRETDVRLTDSAVNLYRVCYYRNEPPTITFLGEYEGVDGAKLADFAYHNGNTRTLVTKQ